MTDDQPVKPAFVCVGVITCLYCSWTWFWAHAYLSCDCHFWQASPKTATGPQALMTTMQNSCNNSISSLRREIGQLMGPAKQNIWCMYPLFRHYVMGFLWDHGLGSEWCRHKSNRQQQERPYTHHRMSSLTYWWTDDFPITVTHVCIISVSRIQDMHCKITGHTIHTRWSVATKFCTLLLAHRKLIWRGQAVCSVQPCIKAFQRLTLFPEWFRKN